MFSPDNALALVMDPNTGEILGMGSRPDYDPNNYQKYSQDFMMHQEMDWFIITVLMKILMMVH